jgi:hypothetical protein
MKIKLSELRHLVKKIIKEQQSKKLLNEITKIEGWEQAKKRFIDTNGIDLKTIDSKIGTTYNWKYEKSASTSNYEYIVSFMNGIVDGGGNTLVKFRFSSDGTWGKVHGHGDPSVKRGEYQNGTWSWGNNKILFNRGATRKSGGIITDKDTDVNKAFFTDNKIATIGSRGILVKKIQQAILNNYSSMDTQKNEVFFMDWHIGDVNKITRDPKGCVGDFNKCDGVFGTGTKNAISILQKDANLQADGVVGKEVATYLFVRDSKNADWDYN